MALIDPSPSSDELKKLTALLKQAEAALQKYLASPAGSVDPNFTALSTVAIDLNNYADMIAIMQLHLAVDKGSKAVEVINDATAELQKALAVRAEVTQDLSIVQGIATFGAAIASSDIGAIISSGSALYNKLAK